MEPQGDEVGHESATERDPHPGIRALRRRLASVSTSDGEGDAAYAYDAFGRVSEACGDYPSYAYSRDACGRVTAEAAADDFDNDRSLLARSFDGFGRPG